MKTMQLIIQIDSDMRDRQCNMTVAGTVPGLNVKGNCSIVRNQSRDISNDWSQDLGRRDCFDTR